MGFSQEIKEFTGGFEKGWKLATPTDAEIKDRREQKDLDEVARRGDEKAGAINPDGSKPYVYKSSDAETGGTGGTGGSSGKLPTFASGSPEAQMAWQGAVASVESGSAKGNYRAIGPVHPKYGRPLGKYQVMESNLPAWSQEVLGRKVSADEFLNNDEIQDKIFNAKFGQSVRKFGNVADAASVWHSGRPLAQAARAGARDSLGTSTVDYARKVQNGLGKRAALELDDEQEQPQSAQFAAEGGLIRSREEMAAEDAPTVQPAVWTDPRVAPPAPAAPVGAIPVAVAVPPGEAVQATSPASPMPPRRPSPGALVTSDGNTMPEPPRRPDDSQLNDSGAALPGEGMTEGSDEAYDPKKLVHRPGIASAIEAGMNEIGKAFGFSQDSGAALPEARPDRQAKLVAFHQNEGAASQEEVNSIDRTIDPQRKLTDDARAVARLYAGYEYFLQKGEPEKAAKYSKSILQYTRNHMQYAGALAQDAIKSGDIPRAAKMITEAHNQIPDGASLYVDKVGPDGTIDYRMVDEDGDMTERGKATTNQLMQLATGMANGSEWLSQMDGAKKSSLTAAQKLREKRREAEDTALDNYNATDTDNEFLATMTPERRAAFDKIPPRQQKIVQAEWRARENQKRAQTSQEDRVKRADDRQTRQEKLDDEKRNKQEKQLQDEQQFSGHRDAIRDAADDLEEQMRADPGDTAKIKPLQDALTKAKKDASDWTKEEAGRAKYTRDLDRVLKPSRGEGGSGKAGAGTEAERTKAALDRQYETERLRVTREGNKPEDVAALRSKKAEIEFMKRDTGFDEKHGEAVDTLLPKELGVGDDISKVKPEVQSDYQDAVGGILRGDNAVSASQALKLVRVAVNTGQILRNDDGSYELGGKPAKDGEPAIAGRKLFLSPEAVTAIKRIRQRDFPQKKEVKADPVLRTQSSPAELEDAADKAARAETRSQESRGRRLRDKSAEASRLKQSLGSDYRDGMTLADMRKALKDRTARDERLNPSPLRPLT